MGKLQNKHIAVTGPRCAEEFTRMVEKMGGTPHVCPAQGTVYSDDRELETQIRRMTETPVDWLVLTTGIGTEALVNKAEELGLKDDLLVAMTKAKIAARGYKTVGALRKLGLQPTVKADDGTTDGVFRAMSDYPLRGKRIALQLYGDPFPRLSRRLQESGAECEELLPYIHIMPDTGPIDQLIDRCSRGTMDAVVVTSTAQARCLFHRAREIEREGELRAAFDGGVLVAAVGHVTAEAIREEGVNRIVVPEEERLGPTLLAIGRAFEAM